jgi:hypothetical protein
LRGVRTKNLYSTSRRAFILCRRFDMNGSLATSTQPRLDCQSSLATY